jgi:hypothetical protein
MDIVNCMMKTTAALLLLLTSTCAFTATKNTTYTSKIYPMENFDPMKFSVSSIPEFVKTYTTESDIFLKKREFETTKEYDQRISKGFESSSLNSNKIYAFEVDSINIQYNPDTETYDILTKSGDINGIFKHTSASNYSDSSNLLRIGNISRKTTNYVASNAYGVKVNVVSIEGKDFYISTPTFLNTIKRLKDSKEYGLSLPVEIAKAKQYANCKKNLYVFARLNGKLIKNSDSDYSVFQQPTREIPFKVEIIQKVIPMDIIGTVLKCSNGTLIYSDSKFNPEKSTTKSLPSNTLAKIEYISALDSYRDFGITEALIKMQNFVKNYPESIYTGDAYYWIASFNLSLNSPNYTEATEKFTIVIDKYPDSSKAPKSLYELYKIAKDVNHDRNLAKKYKDKLISNYPNSLETGFVK